MHCVLCILLLLTPRSECVQRIMVKSTLRCTRKEPLRVLSELNWNSDVFISVFSFYCFRTYTQACCIKRTRDVAYTNYVRLSRFISCAAARMRRSAKRLCRYNVRIYVICTLYALLVHLPPPTWRRFKLFQTLLFGTVHYRYQYELTWTGKKGARFHVHSTHVHVYRFYFYSAGKHRNIQSREKAQFEMWIWLFPLRAPLLGKRVIYGMKLGA